MHIRVLRSVSNEYRLNLVHLEFHYCEMIKRRFFNVMELQFLNGTEVTSCPLQPIRYISNNQQFRDDNLPANVPAGSYRLRFIITLEKNEILALSVYGSVINNKAWD